MKRSHSRRTGFTLVELMIVVAIVGILAATAISSFLHYQLKVKTSEGKTNLAAIRIAEQSYFSEFNVYLSATVSPAGVPDSSKRAFVAAGNNNGSTSPGFTQLGWSPEGSAYFTYAVGTGSIGASFFATAMADLDSNGDLQGWGYRRSSPQVAVMTGHTCAMTDQPDDRVVPCTPAMGQTIF